MRLKPQKNFRIEPSPCPECGDVQDCATPVEGRRGPRPGDFAICIFCAAINRYDENLKLRSITEAEKAALPPDEWKQLEELQTRTTLLLAQLLRNGSK